MFNRLDTNKPGQFRGEIAERIGNFLKILREENNKITETEDYEFMAGIKSLVLAKEIGLDQIIKKCSEYLNKSQKSKPAHEGILECLKQFVAISDQSEYKEIIQKDTIKRHQNKSPVAQLSSSSTLFPTTKKENPPSIKDKLKIQLHNLQNTEISKDELVQVLIAINDIEVKGYTGFFVDLETVTKNKDITGLASLKPDQARAEMLRRENVLLFAEIDNIIEKCISQNINRIQIIVKSAGHYTPIDINIQEKSCFIFDAASEPQKFRLHEMHKFSKYIKIVTDASNPGFELGNERRVGNLQKDKFSCPIFAIDQSREVAKFATIHQELLQRVREYNQHAGIYKVDWLNLPPTVVKNAQSRLFITYYMTTNPSHADEMTRMTSNNTEQFAIRSVLMEFKDKIDNLCLHKTPEEIEDMLKSVVNTTAQSNAGLDYRRGDRR